ncbi:MAG TPA: hypothetical protein VF109_08745 [Mycobacteriales bacterium]
MGETGRAGGPSPTLPRLRRPSGYAPPLPRHVARRDVTLLAVLASTVFGWTLSYLPERSPLQRLDGWLVDLVAREHRDAWTIDAARTIDWIDRPMLNWVALGTVVAPILLGRFRRAFVQLGVLLVAVPLSGLLAIMVNRPRPYGVDIAGRWSGYGAPSVSTTQLAAITVGGAFCLLRPGRPRHLAFAATGAVVALLTVAKAILGHTTPSATLAGGALGALVAVAAFCLLVPDELFPLGSRRRRSAHLDLDVRCPAITTALATQMGVRLLDLKPFGLAGSGGSSPMRLLVDGQPHPLPLFAKLYAQQHVRADRWYKLGRAMLYGRLEDERPFRTVRRMVQNEDYLLRFLRDAGLPVVRPYGFVELTPEREYLLVTEFAEGAKEICDAGVVMEVSLVDDCLRAVRGMWEAGVAHRDVKPSNLLVRNGRLVLIDVAFAEVHPSPWRQAVDLANMMMVLALRTDAETVYRRALRFFSPDDLAEAFAATDGVTVPSQLRSMLATDGRDLLARFRELTPPRPPVKVQKWSPRRIGLIGGTVVAGLVGGLLLAQAILTADPASVRPPVCTTSVPVQLFGQAVPRSAYVPCLPRAYTGDLMGAQVDQSGGTATAAVPEGELLVGFTRDCAVAPARRLSSAGMPLGAEAWAGGTGQVLLTFPGGCVQVDYPAALGRAELALPRVLDVVRLVPRWRLNQYVARLTDGQERTL